MAPWTTPQSLLQSHGSLQIQVSSHPSKMGSAQGVAEMMPENPGVSGLPLAVHR